MDFLEFWTKCSANGIVMDKGQVESIKRYCNELLYWNQKVNLISRQDEEHLLERHIMHSLAIAKYVDFPSRSRCLDVGTGGGLPGIPLKICFPEINMLLVDSIQKKIKITEMLASHTGLRKIEARCVRAEELANDKNNLQNFDIIVSRAVSKISSIVGWVTRIIKPTGKIVLLKGGDLTEEKKFATDYYPKLEIEEIPIKLFGYKWFEQEDKKIVVCTFRQDK